MERNYPYEDYDKMAKLVRAEKMDTSSAEWRALINNPHFTAWIHEEQDTACYDSITAHLDGLSSVEKSYYYMGEPQYLYQVIVMELDTSLDITNDWYSIHIHTIPTHMEKLIKKSWHTEYYEIKFVRAEDARLFKTTAKLMDL